MQRIVQYCHNLLTLWHIRTWYHFLFSYNLTNSHQKCSIAWYDRMGYLCPVFHLINEFKSCQIIQQLYNKFVYLCHLLSKLSMQNQPAAFHSKSVFARMLQEVLIEFCIKHIRFCYSHLLFKVKMKRSDD